MKVSLNQLKRVKGIGPKTIERIKRQLKEDIEVEKRELEITNIKPPKSLEIEEDSIYCGESVEIIRKSIPDNTVKLTVTSPPYDDLRSYDGFSFNYKAMLRELFRVTEEGGIVVWIVGDATVDGSETGTSFKHALYAKEIGFSLHDTMIYYKNNPLPTTGDRYHQHFEYMFVLSKGSPKTFNPIKEPTKYRGIANMKNRGTEGELNYRKIKRSKTKKIGNVFKYSVGGGISTRDKEAFDHPAIFPEKLAEDHILSWSNEGDLVFDPMCGSGTVCKMAKLNGRSFIGIDISQRYVEIAKNRVSGI